MARRSVINTLTYHKPSLTTGDHTPAQNGAGWPQNGVSQREAMSTTTATGREMLVLLTFSPLTHVTRRIRGAC